MKDIVLVYKTQKIDPFRIVAHSVAFLALVPPETMKANCPFLSAGQPSPIAVPTASHPEVFGGMERLGVPSLNLTEGLWRDLKHHFQFFREIENDIVMPLEVGEADS